MSPLTSQNTNNYGLTDEEVGKLRLFHLCVCDLGAGALLLLKAAEQYAHDPQTCVSTFQDFMEAQAYQGLGDEGDENEMGTEPTGDESIVTPLIMLFPVYKPVFEACAAMFEQCIPSMHVFAAVAMALQDLMGENEITEEDQGFDLDRIIRAAVSLQLVVKLAREVDNKLAFPPDALPSDELLDKVSEWYHYNLRRVYLTAMGTDPDELLSLPRPGDLIPEL